MPQVQISALPPIDLFHSQIKEHLQSLHIQPQDSNLSLFKVSHNLGRYSSFKVPLSFGFCR